RFRGRTDSGKVYAQPMKLCKQGRVLRVRRITILLDKPTRDGNHEIHLLTNLPIADAPAAQVSVLYRKRWTIEGRFYEVTQTLHCEPNTLGYPQAALLAFCLALVGSNAVALMKAALRVTHGVEQVETMSSYYMALEVTQTYRGMLVALPPQEWECFRS